MKRRTKKQKAALSARISVCVVILGAVIFVVKEVAKDNLKDLRESFAQAEGRFRTETSQTTIQLQNLNTEEQNLARQLKEQMASGGTGGDYSQAIVQDVAFGQQALAELNSDFDSASRLVDALPWWAFGIRRSRELTRESVNKTNEQVKKMLEPTPNHDLGRIIEVKIATITALLQIIPVSILGDTALKGDLSLQEVCEWLISICNRLIYFLTFLLFGLLLYAAVNGLKADGSE